MSEVDPVKALSNVTAPLDQIWKTLADRLSLNSLTNVQNFISKGKVHTETLKSSLDGSLDSKDTSSAISTAWEALKVAKSVFILTANILVAVLETVLWILNGVLSFIPKG